MADKGDGTTTQRPGATTFQGNPLTLIGDEVRVGQTSPDFTALTGGLALQPYCLADGKGKVRLLNVVVSLDTPVCDIQSRRFADEAAGLPGVEILTVSADLPFSQARWAEQAGVSDSQRMLSDHRDLSFGEAYGIAVKELRLLGRGVFVLDGDDRIVHAEYVKELTTEPDYDRALAAARQAVGVG
jgi:thiol peroxidase